MTIDCPEPAALARFYGALLEWPVPAGDGDYVALDPPGGGTQARPIDALQVVRGGRPTVFNPVF